MVRRLGAWALAACVFLSAGAAGAQSDADRATARQLTAEAERKLTARDYEAAFGLLAKAYSLVPSPMIKIGMGRAKASMNQLIEAQQHFVDASKSAPRPNEPASWAAARESARHEAEAVTPRLASFEFVVEGPSPAALRVTIDGRDEVPKAALENSIPRAVNPGMHAVRAEAEGFRPFETRVGAAEGEKKKVTLRLEHGAVGPLPAKPPVAEPPAPPGGATPPPADAQTTSPADAARAAPSPWNTTTIGGVAVAGVLGSVGLVTGIMSWSRVKAIESRCRDNAGGVCLASEASGIDSAKTLGNVSTFAFAGAAVGGAVALYGFLSNAPAKPDSKQGKVSVVVGPGSFGLSGRF